MEVLSLSDVAAQDLLDKVTSTDGWSSGGVWYKEDAFSYASKLGPLLDAKVVPYP